MESALVGAIRLGAPLYNSGNPSGCAHIYAETALNCLASSLGTKQQRVLLERSLENYRIETSDDKRAWDLRHAFDSILELSSNKISPKRRENNAPSTWELLLDSGSASRWKVVNDTVMGGCSCSQFTVAASGIGAFSGILSEDRNGGFASCVYRLVSPLDLSTFTGLEVECKGDSQRFKLQIRSSARWDGVNYQADFSPSAVFDKVRLPFCQFVPSFRGGVVEGAGELDCRKIFSIGFMVSKLTELGHPNPQFKPGKFRLLVKNIRSF